MDQRPLALDHHIVEAQVRAARAVHRPEPDDDLGVEVDVRPRACEADVGPQRPVGRLVGGEARPVDVANLRLVGQEPPTVTGGLLRSVRRRTGGVGAFDADPLTGERVDDGRYAFLGQHTEADRDDTVGDQDARAHAIAPAELLRNALLQCAQLVHRPVDRHGHHPDVGEQRLKVGLPRPRVPAERHRDPATPPASNLTLT